MTTNMEKAVASSCWHDVPRSRAAARPAAGRPAPARLRRRPAPRGPGSRLTHDHADHGDQRTGNPAGDPLHTEDDGDRDKRDRQRDGVGLGQLPEVSGQLPEGALSRRRECRACPAIWPMATWMPTPVKKPIRTVRDRKSARKPSRMARASNTSKPVMIASTRQARHIAARRSRRDRPVRRP